MSDEKPAVFWGRLYQGKRERDPKNMDFTVDDLRAMSFTDTPIWLEHNGGSGSIGKITESWIDSRDGWLWIKGELHGREQLGERHDELRHRLNSGDLKDLSIHWTGVTESEDSEIVDPSSRCVIEASLTKEGAFTGTNLLTVAASRVGNSQQLHVKVPGQSISLEQPPHMSQDLKALKELAAQRGVQLSDEQVQQMLLQDPTGMQGAMAVIESIIDQAQNNQADTDSKSLEAAKQAALSSAERERLQALEDFKKQHDEAYAKTQGQIAEQIYEHNKGRYGTDEDRNSYKERLMHLSTRPELAPAWDELKASAMSDIENAASLKEMSRQLKAKDKELSEMKTESAAAAAPREVVVEASMQRSRGILKTPNELHKRDASPKRASTKTEETGGRPVDVQASRVKMQADAFFPSAIHGEPGLNDEWNGMLNNLISQPLEAGTLPTAYISHYTGYNQTMPTNQMGFIPFDPNRR